MISYKDDYNNGLNPPIPHYIGVCIMMIAKKMSNHRWFCNYSPHWKEEMIGDAHENVIMYLHNFDPAKSTNPFAYISQIVYYAFKRRLDKEKKQQYIKLKNTESFFLANDLSSENLLDANSLYENNYDFIRQFENRLTAKKKKAKVSGIEKFLT